MKWKPWGREDSAQLTTCGSYSIHHTARGWQAWQRLPQMKRIGSLIEREADAKTACETHAKENLHVTQ